MSCDEIELDSPNHRPPSLLKVLAPGYVPKHRLEPLKRLVREDPPDADDRPS